MGCSRNDFLHFFTDLYMECPDFHWLPGFNTTIGCSILIVLTVLLNVAIAFMIVRKKKHMLWPLFGCALVVAPLALALSANSEWYYLSSWICYAGLWISCMTMLLLISSSKKVLAIPFGAAAAVCYVWYAVQSVVLTRYDTYSDYMNDKFLSAGIDNYEFGFVLWCICSCVVIGTLLAWGAEALVKAVKKYRIQVVKNN